MLKDWSPDLLTKASSVWIDINQQTIIISEPVEYPSEENLNAKLVDYSPSSEEARFILKAFQAEGAINILQEYKIGRRQVPYKWALEVLYPKFFELDSKIKKQLLSELKKRGQLLTSASHETDTSNSSPIQSIPHDKINRTLHWRSLKLDKEKQQIQFNNGDTKELSLGLNHIKLLVLLLENQKVVEYIDIAKTLELNCYHEKAKNADVKREVQAIKRDLVDYLIGNLGMKKQEINNLIVSKNKFGYRLGDE